MTQEGGISRMEKVVGTLRSKGCMKQDVYGQVQDLFARLKTQLKTINDELREACAADDRLVVSFIDHGETSCELRVAGDVIIFSMHTNVFKLEQGHALWKSGYLEEDGMRGYFGLINMYNFLSDSLRFNRERDLGYLVARLFINKEGHFLVQGKRQLGFLFSDLQSNEMHDTRLREVLLAVVDHVIEFDLLVPPYDQVDQITVTDIKELYANRPLSTGKRLGFRFQADMDDLT